MKHFQGLEKTFACLTVSGGPLATIAKLPRLLGEICLAIKIQDVLGLRVTHESTGNKAQITNLFARIFVEAEISPPPLPWQVAVMINSNQICSREGLPHSLLHIMRSGEEN